MRSESRELRITGRPASTGSLNRCVRSKTPQVHAVRHRDHLKTRETYWKDIDRRSPITRSLRPSADRSLTTCWYFPEQIDSRTPAPASPPDRCRAVQKDTAVLAISCCTLTSACPGGRGRPASIRSYVARLIGTRWQLLRYTIRLRFAQCCG